MKRAAVLSAAIAAMLGSTAAPAAPVVERVVLLMRHGVRPPTKNPPMPAGIAADPWPSWPTKPGWLTPHGAEAVKLLGQGDRAVLTKQGLFAAKACPAAGEVRVISDSDQRTIATGDAWIAGFAPGCSIGNAHKSQGAPDAMFGAIEGGAPAFDATKARGAIEMGLGAGGLAAADTGVADALRRLDRIYCGKASSSCGVTAKPTTLAPVEAGQRPKLKGAIDVGSTAAQILLLEYADGRPMGEVGWGRATAEDIKVAGQLHATEFRILARPTYVAAHNVSPIARAMVGALIDPKAAKLTVIVGHDTNVANMGGLLDLHWQPDGFAADDPTPGGALTLVLINDGGRRTVRWLYRSQSLEEIRGFKAPAAVPAPMPIPGCADGCTPEAFAALVGRKLAD